MRANVQLFKNKQGCWQWHIVAGNGEILAVSQAYASKRNCLDTAKTLAEATELSIVKPESFAFIPTLTGE